MEGAILASLSPYLFRCGVLHRLFQSGSFHNLLTNERNQLHTFLFITNPAKVVLELGDSIRLMKNEEYVAPAIEVIEVEVESGFATSIEPIYEKDPLGW